MKPGTVSDQRCLEVAARLLVALELIDLLERRVELLASQLFGRAPVGLFEYSDIEQQLGHAISAS